MRVVNGVRLAFQAGTEDFDHPSPLQVYLSKALSGCVHGLGPCGPGSNPGRETIFRMLTANLYTQLLIENVKMHPALFAALADVVIAPD